MPSPQHLTQLIPSPHFIHRLRNHQARAEAEMHHGSTYPRHGIRPRRLGLDVGDVRGGRWRSEHDQVNINVGWLLVHAGIVEALANVYPEGGLREGGC